MKKSELVEIKKGTTGTGLLVETDGYAVMKNNKLIREGMENGEWYVPNPFIVDAVFQKYGIKNANGRIYPEDVLKREVARYQRLVDEKMALGECNHPSESTIDLSRVSHNIVELHWEGATLVGKIELNVSEGFRKQGIVSTRGDEVAQLLLMGWKIGISSRAVGSVEEKLGNYIVGDDLELIGWDIVATPSTPNAYLSINGKESLEPYIESKEHNKPGTSVISEKINKINNILNG